ncbi:hypothetical protein [Moorena sp. SIO2C4]|uniref:hypothetical protein n=1 Tax=Moorena sp. SIO2C4 TaxID=2607824 RepID=UPI0013C1CF90|nr:hypothetical protein [Moorena sp. SIO2C4]NEQ12915.1 hypothetical protein [Moorena sp. SIO3E2]NES46716.1 hypothetical protein [Moorena sp. SIO2C4]
MRSHQPVSLVIEPVSLISQSDPTSLMTWRIKCKHSAISYQLSANALLEVLLNKITTSSSVSLGLGHRPSFRQSRRFANANG